MSMKMEGEYATDWPQWRHRIASLVVVAVYLEYAHHHGAPGSYRGLNYGALFGIWFADLICRSARADTRWGSAFNRWGANMTFGKEPWNSATLLRYICWLALVFPLLLKGLGALITGIVE